jgi:hypothetical protein
MQGLFFVYGRSVTLTVDGAAVAVFRAIEAAGFALGQMAVVLRFVRAFALERYWRHAFRRWPPACR